MTENRNEAAQSEVVEGYLEGQEGAEAPIEGSLEGATGGEPEFAGYLAPQDEDAPALEGQTASPEVAGYLEGSDPQISGYLESGKPQAEGYLGEAQQEGYLGAPPPPPAPPPQETYDDYGQTYSESYADSYDGGAGYGDTYAEPEAGYDGGAGYDEGYEGGYGDTYDGGAATMNEPPPPSASGYDSQADSFEAYGAGLDTYAGTMGPGDESLVDDFDETLPQQLTQKDAEDIIQRITTKKFDKVQEVVPKAPTPTVPKKPVGLIVFIFVGLLIVGLFAAAYLFPGLFGSGETDTGGGGPVDMGRSKTEAEILEEGFREAVLRSEELALGRAVKDENSSTDGKGSE